MNILCFGDSNTWGLVPMVGCRYDRDTRWTGRLEKMSDGAFHIIEEGLNGRTANEVDIEEPYLNGRNYMEACLLSHRPVDFLIVMLGSNDIKVRYGKNAEQIAQSIGDLLYDMKMIMDDRQAEKMDILLVSPKSIDERILGDNTFDKESIEKSRKLATLLKARAEKENWHFLDADEAGVTLGDDGLHLSKEGHAVLAESILEILMKTCN